MEKSEGCNHSMVQSITFVLFSTQVLVIVKKSSPKNCQPTVGQLSADRFFGELFFTITVNFSGSQLIWFIHGSINNLKSFLFLSGKEKKQSNEIKWRKWPEMPFRPSQRDCSITVCCSFGSHFGIALHFVQVQIYCCWHFMTIFLTCHIKYLPLYKRKWV